MYDAAQTVTINTTSIYHLVPGFSTGLVDGFTFLASATGAITVFADGGGGLVTVTSAGHGLADGQIVSITGTTNYNGVFVVQNKTTDTFQITDTWVADDATGTWDRGSSLRADIGSDGIYYAALNVSANSAVAAKEFRTEIFKNASGQDNISTLRDYTSVNVGNSAASGTFSITVGDYITVATKNNTDTNNLVIDTASLTLIRI
jgi:hypothetical protein